MNKLFFSLACFILISCGAESAGEDQSDEAEVDATVNAVKDSSEVEVLEEAADYVPENVDGLWQIDDYAELMKGKKIYNSHEDIPDGEWSNNEFFQELDLKGGFASVTGAYEGWSEYVIWRMTENRTLLGTMSAGCGPVCSYSFQFYIFDDKNEIISDEAGSEVLPLEEMAIHEEKLLKKVLEKYPDLEYPEDHGPKYSFPRKGTSMTVDLLVGADEIQIPMLKLSWNKMKFEIDEYYEEVK